MRLTNLALLLASSTPLWTVPSQQSTAADPPFDYTNLRPSDEEMWAGLSGAKLTLDEALDLALASFEQGEARARSARFIGADPPHYVFEVFVFGEGADQRYDVEVSALEPKVTAKTALEPVPSEAFRQVAVLMPQAIDVVRSKSEPESRVGLVKLVEPEGRAFEIELYQVEKTMPVRFEYRVSAAKTKIIHRILRDRFPGEPLRTNKPVALPSGLLIHDFVQGDGAQVTRSSNVRTNYRLWLLDGTKIKDTWQSNKPETFVVEKAALPGMVEGMEGMRIGGRRKIVIPHSLAYGDRAVGNVPERAAVVVDIEIVAAVE
jgi:FKBP-type peptidyl-prolyl cis-trans isomerase